MQAAYQAWWSNPQCYRSWNAIEAQHDATKGLAMPPDYQIEDWDAAGVAQITATGADPTRLIGAGLSAVLAAARGDIATLATGDATTAAAIRGQGSDLAAVFTELAADLLSQLDANGACFGDVRLDGLLTTDDGYTAWGYAVGEVIDNPPPVGLSLDDAPAVEVTPGGLTLRFALRRV